MCGRCDAIDTKIQRYRWLQMHLSDPRTLSGLKVLIEIMEAKRASLRPLDENSAPTPQS
jgi:hypothetical protein